MTPRLALPPSSDSAPALAGFPDADELAALRAWYAGMTVRQAVERYLPGRLGEGRSARGVIGAIRRRLARVARQAGRPDLAEQLGHADRERMQQYGETRKQALAEAKSAGADEKASTTEIERTA